jgi:uncharacterized RDD family membrane protein YckC
VTAPGKLTIDTPEQVSLEFTLASVGSRFLALAVDTLVQVGGFLLILLAVVIAASFSAVGFRQLGLWALAALVLLAFLVSYGYFVVFEALWQGQTPGKRLVGLRVIGVTGRPIGVYEAVIRNLLRLVDQLPGIYVVGILAVLLTPRHQRLGDLAAATVVVHERPLEPERLSYRAAPARAHHGAARLTGQEIAVVESFLRRRDDLDDDVRSRTAAQIAQRIRARLEVGAEPPDEALLEQVAAEYRATGRYR